jgi:hypothetical protein
VSTFILVTAFLVVSEVLSWGVQAEACSEAQRAQDAASSQSSGSSAASQASESEPGPSEESKKAKKVWTNENIAAANGPVSVVGNGKLGPNAKVVPARQVDAQTIANFKRQLEKFQTQLDDADKQIADLKKFSEGEPTGNAGMEWHKGYNMEPIEAQIRKLEQKKKNIQGQRDALLDDARKKGVEPGQLR